MLLLVKLLELSLNLVEATSQILQVGPEGTALVHQAGEMLFGSPGQIGCAGCPGPLHPAAPGRYVLGQPQQLLALLLRFALQLLCLLYTSPSPRD